MANISEILIVQEDNDKEYPRLVWIAVEDGFPPEGESVLLFFPVGEGVDIGFRYNGSWRESDIDDDVYADHLISHWMRLPEAP